MLGEGKNRRVPKLSLPTVQQTETETRGSKLADSKFSTRVAIWISPGNFVCETRWITFSIWWSDRKIYSCVINKQGWVRKGRGGEENTRREISQKGFVYRRCFEQFRANVWTRWKSNDFGKLSLPLLSPSWKDSAILHLAHLGRDFHEFDRHQSFLALHYI